MKAGTSPSLAIPPPAPTPSTGGGAADNCAPQIFADAVLSYPVINGIITASNKHARKPGEGAP